MAPPTVEPSIDIIDEGRSTASAIAADPFLAVTLHEQRLRITGLVEQIGRVNDTILAERNDHAMWEASLEETVHDHADQSRWCEVADTGMSNVGIPTRPEKEEDVPWEAIFTITKRVESDELYEDALRIAGDGNVSDSDIGVEVTGSLDVEFTYTLTGEISSVGGMCVCGEITRAFLYDLTPAWLDTLEWNFHNDVTVSCDAC